LMESARSPFVFLALAGIIMCVAMVTSKKARKVVKTSTSLSRQDEGEEMFGSSRVARSIVRFSQSVGDVFGQYVPRSALGWLDSRFNKEDADLRDGAAFDEIRASVNLVLAAMLIIMGTTLKLPLSTTYVTFMVAMGASLADRAWSRESAVFRITGVISVIGGWFITAGVAFAAASIVCSIMYYGSAVAMFLFMGLAVFVLWRSHTNYEEQVEAPEVTSARVMLRAKDSGEVWNLLRAHFVESQSMVLNLMLADYRQLVEAMEQGDLKTLRRVQRNLKAAAVSYKRNRRLELIALRRSPMEVAIERGTWFHLAQNSDQQFIYCLTRVLDPVLEHVDNGFEPIPKTYMTEYAQVLQRVEVLIQSSQTMIQTGDYGDYKNIREVADHLKDELSTLRKTHIRRIQSVQTISLTTSTLYLNLLQETQELLSIMRHQLRSTRNFTM
ncbi:MAG: inorganic phosphate transporter, partial [Bacteroidaceae bacterium]|nr:inorganic phosphate transporter [Bacteroidaceae bacterium]